MKSGSPAFPLPSLPLPSSNMHDLHHPVLSQGPPAHSTSSMVWRNETRFLQKICAYYLSEVSLTRIALSTPLHIWDIGQFHSKQERRNRINISTSQNEYAQDTALHKQETMKKNFTKSTITGPTWSTSVVLWCYCAQGLWGGTVKCMS